MTNDNINQIEKDKISKKDNKVWDLIITFNQRKEVIKVSNIIIYF